MSKIEYEDDRCVYQDPDPRFDPMDGSVTLSLSDTELKVAGSSGDTIAWPLKSITAVQRGIIGMILAGNRTYGVRFWVTDPEGVYKDGLTVSIGCRNDYYAQVMARRLGKAAGIEVSETDETELDRGYPL